MATYNVQKSRTGLGVAIPDAASPDTQTDLHLVGQNAVSYGLDVAQSFYFLLENFAKTTEPANKIEGQLWYDITGAAKTLKVWNSSTWDEVANTNRGSSAVTSTLRWDNGNNKWSEDVRVTIDGSGTLGIVGPTPGNNVTFSHDDTDLNIVGTSTTAINVTSGITTVTLPEITLTTALAEIQGGTGTATYAAGDVLYASGVNTLAKLTAGANGEVLTLAAGVPSWASGGGTGTVTSATQANNQVAVWTAVADEIEGDAGFTWNGSTLFATNVTGTNIGGITSGNLVDKSALETIAGPWTFTNAAPIIANAGDILASNGNGLSSSNGAGAIAIRHDGTDTNITHSSTTDFNITGVGGNFIVDAPIHATSGGAESFRVIGDNASWSGADSYISLYGTDQLTGDNGLQIGTLVADGAGARINARLGDLDLYAANTKVFDINATETIITQGGGTALTAHAVTGTNITSSIGVYDSGATERNVGYNETPTSVLTSKTIVVADIGKFLTRTGTTAAVLTLANVTAIPIGGSCVVHNGNASNTLTIATGGLTLHWIDGSGTLPSSGTRTIAYNSVVTLRKVSSTIWQIWGNGIS